MRILRSPAGEADGWVGGFTLVELLVVVSIIVALAAASVVAVGQFAGRGEAGAMASEKEAVQAAMDGMMAAKSLGTVNQNAGGIFTGVQNFTALPTGTNAEALAGYMRKNPTVYFYCWDGTGKVKQLPAGSTALTACPVGPY